MIERKLHLYSQHIVEVYLYVLIELYAVQIQVNERYLRKIDEFLVCLWFTYSAWLPVATSQAHIHKEPLSII